MRTARILLLGLLCACSNNAQAPLTAADIVVARPVPTRATAVAYIALTNSSRKPIVITDVRSPQYARVEIHETLIEDDVSRMRRLTELTIPPGETLRLEPAGKHLMLLEPVAEDIRGVELQLFSDDVLLMRIGAKVTR